MARKTTLSLIATPGKPYIITAKPLVQRVDIQKNSVLDFQDDNKLLDFQDDNKLLDLIS